MARILIVDDALFMRKMLSDILSEQGHDIIGEATNAKDAIELYKQLKPDLVTLDIIMPEIDGVTSLHAIKAIKSMDSNAIIIMVSAMGQQSVVAESIHAGATDFIIKPFQKTDVINAVNKRIAIEK